jgi:hypothetical protein
MVPGSLQSVASLLTQYGLLGLLITMPPALLLALGLKKKGRWTQLFSGALMLSLACAVGGVSIDGLDTGKGLALSKSTLMVNEGERPIFFWISTAAFLAGSALIAIFGIVLMWRGLRPATAPKDDGEKVDF